jgi:hypothetical protein
MTGGPPRLEVVAKWPKELDRAHPPGLGGLDLAERDRTFDRESPLSDIAPPQPQGFTGPHAGLCEDADERGIAQRELATEALDHEWRKRVDRATRELRRLADLVDGIGIQALLLYGQAQDGLQYRKRLADGRLAHSVPKLLRAPAVENPRRQGSEAGATQVGEQVLGQQSRVADLRVPGEVGHDVEFPPLPYELGEGHVELGCDEATELLAAPNLEPKRHGVGADVEGAPVAAAALTPANLPTPGSGSAESHAVTTTRVGPPPPPILCRRAANHALRMAPDEVIGSATTPEGRVVELTAARWSYIRKHAEMEGRMDLVLQAVETPERVDPDARPGRERFWLRPPPPFPFRWLRVVVEFAGETDRVVTAFGQDNPPAGRRSR